MTAGIEASRLAECRIPAPFGSLVIRANSCGLLSVDISLQECVLADGESTPLLEQAASQFGAYFQNAAFRFTLPLVLQGSPHQRRVWNALVGVPPGETISYGGLAQKLGSGPRAVAAACRANYVPLVIPCHRVVGSNTIGGYCGETEGAMLDVKRWLLHHERSLPAACNPG